MGLFSPQISAKEMVPLCRQLATAYDAGIPIIKSIEMVSRNTKTAAARQVLETMGERLRAGSTLGEAAREQQKYLPQFFVELLASGEYGGKLDIMLRDVADYYEDRVAMQRMIAGQMVYPAVLLVIAWFIGSFALMLVGQLDFQSGKPFDFPTFLAKYMAFQGTALLVAGGAFAASVVLSRFGAPQFGWGWFTTHVWPLKNVTRKFALARFFRSMSLLIASGVRIKECIINSAEVTSNAYIRKDLLRAVPLVAEGATLVQAFSMANTLTPVAREMLNVGEQTGNLDGCLRKVAEYHFAEAQHAVQVAVKVMGTVIFLVVAGIIGFIVISFYARLLSGYESFLN